MIQQYRERNGCSDSFTVSYEKSKNNHVNELTRCYTFDNCAANTTYCIIENGGHNWHSENENDCLGTSNSYVRKLVHGPKAYTFDSSKQILDFFVKYLNRG